MIYILWKQQCREITIFSSDQDKVNNYWTACYLILILYLFLVAFFYSCFQLLLVTPNVTWTCSEHKCLTSRQHRPIFVLLHHYYIHKFPRWNNPHASWRGCGSAYRDSLEIIEQNYYVSWCFQKYSRKIPVLSGNPLVILSKPHQGILHPSLNKM